MGSPMWNRRGASDEAAGAVVAADGVTESRYWETSMDDTFATRLEKNERMGGQREGEERKAARDRWTDGDLRDDEALAGLLQEELGVLDDFGDARTSWRSVKNGRGQRRCTKHRGRRRISEAGAPLSRNSSTVSWIFWSTFSMVPRT